MKIAGETDYFYAPLANRLGLYHVKSELENLSFRYRCPREFEALEREFQKERQTCESGITLFVNKIQQIMAERGISVRTEVKYRTAYSIWRKMQSVGCDLHHVDGKHYIRIIYDAEGHLEEKKTSLHIYAVLTDYFKERPGSVSNYINAPKENGYQSFHLKLLSEQGTWEEIHISFRTDGPQLPSGMCGGTYRGEYHFLAGKIQVRPAGCGIPFQGDGLYGRRDRFVLQ